MKNYYQILEINRNASSDEIKMAYRKLAQKFHPDKNNGDKFFEDKFIQIQEAYEVLINTNEKEKYDIHFDIYFNKQEFAEAFNARNNDSQNGQTGPLNEQVKKEKAEKERIATIKKNAELQFEDKAWIFLGNWFIIPGAVGLWMFFKYRNEGYTKKSNTVCSLTFVSFVVLFILAIILVLAKEAGNQRY